MNSAGTTANTLYADVALGIPQDEPYQYSIPSFLKEKIKLGARVKVPLGPQFRYGYVVSTSQQPAKPEIKPIAELIDNEPLLSEPMQKLTRWMSEYYFCSWGQAIETAMPAPFKRGKTTMRAVASKREEELLDPPPLHRLTEAQQKVMDRLQPAVNSKRFGSFLLHGITGSGKTEIYLKLIEMLVAQGRGAIVLVPEISLTPQATKHFRERFGDKVAVIHSRVSVGKRVNEWHRIKSGEAQVVVGARSAVFSPVKDLGLIVIDEEHDSSYKQDETPRYDAGRVAEKRCELENAVLLRASATPLLESYYGAQRREGAYLSLPERIEKRPLPAVEVVDMRNEKAGKSIRMFSIPLENAIRKALAQNEQVMLLMNRRGFSPYVYCPTCGQTVSCPRCRVSLVYHREREGLLCHVCHYTADAPSFCPSCDKGKVHYFGIGTEKVEEEAKKLFSGARIERMDRDNTSRVDAHEKILKSFRKREIDVLIGTQMIAKGHDFPNVSVIGVISAETALNIPDFRSAEQTFDLLTQVAGRAGRKDIIGNVYIQTFLPAHYAIQAAKDHDYREFYDQEIRHREALGFPPYSHMVQVLFSAKNEKSLFRKALEFKRITETEPLLARSLGPAPCVISKRYDQFFWNVFYKIDDIYAANAVFRKLLKSFVRGGVKITVNVDPR